MDKAYYFSPRCENFLIMEPFHVVSSANTADARHCTGYTCCTFPLRAGAWIADHFSRLHSKKSRWNVPFQRLFIMRGDIETGDWTGAIGSVFDRIG